MIILDGKFSKQSVRRGIVYSKSLSGWELYVPKQKLKDRSYRTLIGNIQEGCRIRNTCRWWLSKGKPAPVPHTVKQLAVKTFAQKYGVRVFIETVPYLGGMVAEVSNYFVRE